MNLNRGGTEAQRHGVRQVETRFEHEETEVAEPKAKRGRPGRQGKRLNPDYSQVTACIPTKLHDETKINLIRQGKREFSEIVAELRAAWNRKQNADH